VTSAVALLTSRPFRQAMLMNFLFFMGMNLFLLLPIHVQQMGGDEADVGLVQGAYSLAGILFQPLVGLWVNRLGRGFFMRLGALLLALSAAGLVFSHSIPLHAALRAVQGLAFSAFFVANYIHIVDLSPVERRGWALGIFGLSGLMSTALAPLLGEAVLRQASFRWCFVLAALLAAGSFAIILRTKGIRPPAPGGGPGLAELREGLQEVLRVHMVLGFFFGLGTGTVFTFLPTFAEQLGVTGLGFFYTAYATSAVAARVFGGDLIDTQGRRAVIVPCMIIFTAAVCIFALLAGAVGPGVRVPVLPFIFLAGFLGGGAHGSSIRRCPRSWWTSPPTRGARARWGYSARCACSAMRWGGGLRLYRARRRLLAHVDRARGHPVRRHHGEPPGGAGPRRGPRVGEPLRRARRRHRAERRRRGAARRPLS
jgi:MFS family permease